MRSTWDPGQYIRFAGERERPFSELVSRIQTQSPRGVVDLGCGPGSATARLLQRWPQASIVGIDSSPAMIERAAALAQPPKLCFELQDLRAFAPDAHSLDVIISNATLHWVDGHLDLLPRWLQALRAGGAFALQVPRNFDAPSHIALTELARSPEWSHLLEHAALPRQPAPEEYYARFGSLGASIDMWETTYHHVLEGDDPVLQWVKGTALTPYLPLLDEQQAADFTQSYAATLSAAYPRQPSGETIFPFKRLFVVASV